MARKAKIKSEPLPFARVLKRIRKERGLTLKDIADMAQISAVSTVSAWEAGNTPNDLLAVRRLAKALGVSSSYLLYDEPDTIPANPSELFSEGQKISGIFKLELVQLLPIKSNSGNGNT